MKIINNLKYHWQLYLIITIFAVAIPKVTLAQATKTETNPGLLSAIDNIFSQLVAILGKVLFLEITGFPLIGLWTK
ncbi:hypothetical protein NIES4102_04330 [Chondrocystis sp. NIES-4102]|nr:hypothetical protein NIES4102_04330 [Chondrocystis sp. NIES-4102]